MGTANVYFLLRVSIKTTNVTLLQLLVYYECYSTTNVTLLRLATLRRLIIVPGGLITRTGRGLGGAFGGPGGAFGGPGGGFLSSSSGLPLPPLSKPPPGPPKAPPGPPKAPPRPLPVRVISPPGTIIKRLRVLVSVPIANHSRVL